MSGVAPPAPLAAVLGGTFDPVHLGHLHAARCVRRVFAPARFLLVPCALPPHKSRPDLTAAEHRLAMLRLAIEDQDGLEVSTLELERGGVSYAIDTLHALSRATPPLAPVFVLGMDSLFEIPTWHRHADLLRGFDLIVVDRPRRDFRPTRARLPAEVTSRLIPVPFDDGAASRLPGPPPGTGGRVYHLPLPTLAISSSHVRRAAALGVEVGGLVPPAVARYIQDHELYRREGRR